MKRLIGAIRNFVLPPADAKLFTRILPLATIAIIVVVFFVAANFAWEETNSVSFCGLTCHTMPPEYITHKHSAHTNVLCEDCHMGRDKLAVLIPRKIKYSWQTGSAMMLNSYEFPIIAKDMAPAREACENCHKPEKFSTDQLVEVTHYAPDEANTKTSTFLVMKTGGGSSRQGLGYGIHWHIENPVYFYATDNRQQDIPYVVVQNADGTREEYIDVEANFDPASVKEEDLIQMDCITCHNRTAHLIDSPQGTMDELMKNGLVWTGIPEIKLKGVEVLSVEYGSVDEANEGIAGLKNYYQQYYSGFVASNGPLLDSAILAIQEAYARTNFPLQKVDSDTHFNNLEHKDSAGCFRCHDGQHLNTAQEAVRLECNLCHSIPVVSTGTQLTANIELNKGYEPESHKNASWISLHREIFDETCQSCHTVEDAGGISNTSFCSNSACHGNKWTFAGFDAPKVREILMEQAKAFITPTPVEPVATPAPVTGPITFDNQVGALLKNK